jgi:hypothetical protein
VPDSFYWTGLAIGGVALAVGMLPTDRWMDILPKSRFWSKAVGRPRARRMYAAGGLILVAWSGWRLLAYAFGA